MQKIHLRCLLIPFCWRRAGSPITIAQKTELDSISGSLKLVARNTWCAVSGLLKESICWKNGAKAYNLLKIKPTVKPVGLISNK